MAKQAKFFCENCGAEVAQNARFCNKCGRFFSSVRCPVCGKTGSSLLFADGCPVCGYGGKGQPGIAGNFKTLEQAKNDAVKNKGHFFLHKKYSGKKTNKNTGDGSLPLWIYIVTLAALAGSLIGIIRCS